MSLNPGFSYRLKIDFFTSQSTVEISYQGTIVYNKIFHQFVSLNEHKNLLLINKTPFLEYFEKGERFQAPVTGCLLVPGNFKELPNHIDYRPFRVFRDTIAYVGPLGKCVLQDFDGKYLCSFEGNISVHGDFLYHIPCYQHQNVTIYNVKTRKRHNMEVEYSNIEYQLAFLNNSYYIIRLGHSRGSYYYPVKMFNCNLEEFCPIEHFPCDRYYANFNEIFFFCSNRRLVAANINTLSYGVFPIQMSDPKYDYHYFYHFLYLIRVNQGNSLLSDVISIVLYGLNDDCRFWDYITARDPLLENIY